MTNSIPQKQAPRQQYHTVDDILKQACPECGFALTVANFHVGGYPNDQAHAVCQNPDGGYAHVQVRIPERLARDYWDVVQAMDEATTGWEEETCEEVRE